MRLKSIRIRNFKAIQDSGPIKLGPLTAFVGYNGTGKSSILEACEFFHTYATSGLDTTLNPWFNFDHLLWQGADRAKAGKTAFFNQPLQIALAGRIPKAAWAAALEIGELAEPVGNYPAGAVVPKRELLQVGDNKHEFLFQADNPARPRAGSQVLDQDQAVDFREWVFLSLNPTAIGQPRRRPASTGQEPLLRSGANLADILKSFLDVDQPGFDAMVDALQHIVPYAANIRPDITKDFVETRSLLQLTEKFHSGRSATLPGWVLSGGTLRLLALLAALRHPQGPSVLFIEELENGLDPRAIGFVVDEIRSAITLGEKQVILTTHSPYLLDKLSLEHIVTVERPDGEPPTFRRPAEESELKKWAEKFAPGSLYSMGMLRSKERRTR